MFEYSLRAFKKQIDEDIGLIEASSPNGKRTNIEREHPTCCLLVTQLHRFPDALISLSFGVIR
jgi:hypothetical protein